jgi:hypothetical protein
LLLICEMKNFQLKYRLQINFHSSIVREKFKSLQHILKEYKPGYPTCKIFITKCPQLVLYIREPGQLIFYKCMFIKLSSSTQQDISHMLPWRLASATKMNHLQVTNKNYKMEHSIYFRMAISPVISMDTLYVKYILTFTTMLHSFSTLLWP